MFLPKYVPGLRAPGCRTTCKSGVELTFGVRVMGPHHTLLRCAFPLYKLRPSPSNFCLIFFTTFLWHHQNPQIPCCDQPAFAFICIAPFLAIKQSLILSLKKEKNIYIHHG